VKRRDQNTGEIISIEVPDLTGVSELTVVDDICDGGATFIKLRELIDSSIKLNLHVTYGIFSKGLDILYKAGYTKITYNYRIQENEQSIIAY
jgi:ribose-phosphate pyrophosphokinase